MFFNLRSEATLREAVEFSGIGVHSGKSVVMKVFPAFENSGIVFKRTDVLNKNSLIKLSPDSVVDPTLCTRVVNENGVSVAVIEHLLAAFRICGITNALIELNSQEVPIMDGSAIEFVKAFRRSGIVYQDAFVPAIVISKPIIAKSQNGEISISPSENCEISVKISYDRINPVIGENNSYSFNFDDNLNELSSSRTFGWIEDYDKVRAMGLAQGSSEENTIAILSDNTIKNVEGLRNPNELVMHKCLDLIGDISVIGYDIIGKMNGFNTSHSLNNVLMRKLLKEISNHKVIRSDFAENFERVLNFA